MKKYIKSSTDHKLLVDNMFKRGCECLDDSEKDEIDAVLHDFDGKLFDSLKDIQTELEDYNFYFQEMCGNSQRFEFAPESGSGAVYSVYVQIVSDDDEKVYLYRMVEIEQE